MLRQIVEEKFPLRHAPHINLFMTIEADQEASDQIEFPQDVGQGIESFDFPDHTAHVEQARNVAKHRDLIQIEPEPFVPEQLSDVKEISCTGAKIENPLSPCQIDFDPANPANVDFDPSLQIQIFRPVLGGTFNGIALANSLEAIGIDCFDPALRLQTKTVRPKKSERVPSCASPAFAIYKLVKFMRKFLEPSHWKIDHSLWRIATISTKLQMQ